MPEVSGTRLDQKIKGWPLGQALIISAGIQPGILLNKGGLFNLKIPGTVPTGTEVICCHQRRGGQQPAEGERIGIEDE